ncbi:DUF998 domain-containing protein [Motilibacter aurantiacus]|uniref:DUF998 domain-containing protein n=1 Tax=Motilibacter aurantiacus TaxID=2714955 RepID=UPI0014076B84|nr:DUF998 domain-containing protein [Motilibacter aurantiacus]
MASAAAAPVLLVGGWTLAAARQPDGFDAVRGSISALAGAGAADAWVMTGALAGLGACHLVTASGLRAAPAAARAGLALGGLATFAVAATPLPAEGGSGAHAVAAVVAFGALAAWPALGRRSPVVRLLRPLPAAAAAAALGALVLWVGQQAVTGGAALGLSERAAAGAQAVYPLLVVLSARARRA